MGNFDQRSLKGAILRHPMLRSRIALYDFFRRSQQRKHAKQYHPSAAQAQAPQPGDEFLISFPPVCSKIRLGIIYIPPLLL
ncbi:MAG: hypothetical protein J6C98_08830 [Oscillospiraceae bacterium]|nr:hypothetical protein [Oscillospiraceae bacterium]